MCCRWHEADVNRTHGNLRMMLCCLLASEDAKDGGHMAREVRAHLGQRLCSAHRPRISM